MSGGNVRIKCSNGFVERGFKDHEAAQRWIDNFVEAQKKHESLCQGEHTIVSSDEVVLDAKTVEDKPDQEPRPEPL